MEDRAAYAFRFRFPIHVVIFTLGFAAPWDRMMPSVTNLSTWLVLAAAIARQEWLSFTAATVAVLVAATVLATIAAGLRTWATAWMGHWVVGGGALVADRLVADGPYRRMRNPLYVGVVLHTVALSILMPPTGAVFAILTTGLFDLWLAKAEERFLQTNLGESYREYQRAVPAVVPRLRATVRPSGRTPRWGQSALGEIYFWGVAISFATLGWKYNAFLLQRGVLVSFGGALVVRALLPKPRSVAR